MPVECLCLLWLEEEFISIPIFITPLHLHLLISLHSKGGWWKDSKKHPLPTVVTCGFLGIPEKLTHTRIFFCFYAFGTSGLTSFGADLKDLIYLLLTNVPVICHSPAYLRPSVRVLRRIAGLCSRSAIIRKQTNHMDLIFHHRSTDYILPTSRFGIEGRPACVTCED